MKRRPAANASREASLANRPELLLPPAEREGRDVAAFARMGAEAVAQRLGLRPRD